jgi:hypothetical protein
MTGRRLVWIVVAVIAILLTIYLLAFWAFNSGGEVPGSGTGEILTTPTP